MPFPVPTTPGALPSGAVPTGAGLRAPPSRHACASSGILPPSAPASAPPRPSASPRPPPAAPTAPTRIRDLVLRERPQERLERLGPGALGDAELLALLLRSGTRGHDVLSVASRLLSEGGSLAALVGWGGDEFRRQRGIGRVKALQLVAVMEVARRALEQKAGDAPLLNRADLVAAHLAPVAAGLAIEKFWVLCLNRRNRLLRRVEVTSGTATCTLAHPREVFRAAIRESAAAIVCAHNHPSGDPAASSADVRLTRQLKDAAVAVDIPMLDHIIVGREEADPLGRGYYSFREAGVL